MQQSPKKTPPHKVIKKKINQKKRKELEKLRNPTDGMINWATRDFSPVTGPQGYTFLYLATPKRLAPSAIRRKLTILGINTRRIIDIHLPTKGVIGILIHQSYVDEFTATLTRHNITTLTFDPTAASVIADPKFENITEFEKKKKATAIHQERIGRICANLRNRHLGTAIINHFHRATDHHHINDTIHAAHFQSNPPTNTTTNSDTQDFLFDSDLDEINAACDASEAAHFDMDQNE